MPNILIADDHDLVRDTLAAFLARLDGFNIESAANLDECLQKMEGMLSFDLAILDYHMPGMNELQGLQKAISRYPATKFALMSGVAKPDVAREAMNMGACGYFPKSLSADTLKNAVQFVLAGERYFPFDLAQKAEADEQQRTFYGLTGREIETLRGLCKGQSNKEIARLLDLQEVTVKLHVKNILTKLGVKNRTQAALRAQNDGFE